MEENKKTVKDFRSKHSLSFKFALEGVGAAFKSQPNLKIIFGVGFLVGMAGFYFKVSEIEWLILILTCFMVLVAEMANTAMEATVNLITKEWREEAKFAKDVTAGGVFLASLGSVVIGIIIFLPKVIDILKTLL